MVGSGELAADLLFAGLRGGGLRSGFTSLSGEVAKRKFCALDPKFWSQNFDGARHTSIGLRIYPKAGAKIGHWHFFVLRTDLDRTYPEVVPAAAASVDDDPLPPRH